MPQRARVALLIDTATSWGAGLIEGIAEFANARDDWQLFHGPRGRYERMLLPEDWEGEGVIARITHDSLAQQIVSRRIPAVNVSWYRFGEGAIARCTCDERGIAELASKYFVERGFRQFAYCGSSLRANYTDSFGDAFDAAIRRKNYICHRYAPPCAADIFLPSPVEVERLINWLQGLPKPIGLLAFDSLQARQITDACQLAGIDVPHQIAVLGGEHDLLSCTISKPELSSIDHAPQRVGWAAADLLLRMMQGEPAPTQPVLLTVTRVITRQSTDTLAVVDELLAAAIRYIKDHSHQRLQVGDLLHAVPISRRALEKGFRKVLGRSPAEEIRRVRVDHAVQLLCDTNLAMPKIAVATGFERPELLTRAFRRELNMTPSEFRRKHRRERLATNETVEKQPVEPTKSK